MINPFKRTILATVFGACVCSAAGVHAQSGNNAAQSADAHIVDVTAITEVYTDGLKVSAVAIQYDMNIRDASLKTGSFAVQTDVPGQKITQVYTSNDVLKTTRRGANGKYVILELSTDYVLPVPAKKAPPAPPAGPRPPQQQPQQAARPEPAKPQPFVLSPEVVAQVGPISWDPTAHPGTLRPSKSGNGGKSVSVSQIGEIGTTDGVLLTASTTPRDNLHVRNLIVDGFMKPDFTTSSHGNVKYNIRFPRNYDASKKYPVVVFISDSDSPNGYTHAEYLTHGLGATVWAGQEDEARHPAIIIVPAFPRAMIGDDYEPVVETRGNGQTSTAYLAIVDCIDGLLQQIPSVDRSRVYLTGQGDGTRAALRMMTDRPNLFAAALLFAPDYDAARTAPLLQAKIWLVASKGDSGSYESMERFTESLKANGAHVAKAEWNGRATAAQFAAEVRRVAGQNANINYSVLKQGSVVPANQPDDALHNHAYTWRIGYSIQPLREWLFAQAR